MSEKSVILQTQRDRFLAFAFAAADLLLEVDGKGDVAYASGATMKLLGRDSREMAGTAFLDLIAPIDRGLVQAALARMNGGARLQTLNVVLARPGADVRAWVNGYRMPVPGGPAHIAISSTDRFAQRMVQAGTRDEGSSLLDGGAMADALGAAVESGGISQGDVLTLLEVEGLDDLSRRITPIAFQGLMSEIGGFLRLQSGGRDLAGRLGEVRFGVLHEGTDSKAMEDHGEVRFGVLHEGTDRKAMEDHIGALSRSADPSGTGVSIASHAIAMGLANLTPGEAARAVIHTLKLFERDGLQAVEVQDLNAAFQDMLNGTINMLADFKKVLSDNAVDLVYQPIVGLPDGKVHHFELLARFRDGRKTFEMVTFGESMGMNSQLDLLVCRRAIDDISADHAGSKLSLAVNLSGNSLQDSIFAKTLLELLRDHGSLAGRLLFEVTESAEITDLAAVDAVLQQIRGRGFQVCLDDFGAGAASFQYLQALTVDFVKIDGAYIRRLDESARDRHMLAAITALCRELKVGVIAEMVENRKQADLLVELGVTHAQGYLYGKPAAEPAGFERRSARVGRRGGAREVWG